MNFSTNNFSIRHAGSSYDRRTNVWEFTSKCCKQVFKPVTTMLRYQTVECPKCGQSECIDYNTEQAVEPVIRVFKGTNLKVRL